MLALAGYPLGLHFRFLDPSPEAPVGRIAQRVTADFSDQAALENSRAAWSWSLTNLKTSPSKLLNFSPPASLYIRLRLLSKPRRIASRKNSSSRNSASPPLNLLPSQNRMNSTPP